MEEERLRAILESLLFAAGEPVKLAQLASVLDNVPRVAIRAALAEMGTAFTREGRGIVLDEVAGGFQLRTPKEHAMYVRKLLSSKPPRLSRPLLETLAIIAYRQPVTRPEIEQLRGVDTGGVLETLLERRLIRIAGRKEAPGRPLMYATTAEFLEAFGLKDLENLPDLDEFREVEGRRQEAQLAPDSTPDPEQGDLLAPLREAGQEAAAEASRQQEDGATDTDVPSEPLRGASASAWAAKDAEGTGTASADATPAPSAQSEPAAGGAHAEQPDAPDEPRKS